MGITKPHKLAKVNVNIHFDFISLALTLTEIRV